MRISIVGAGNGGQAMAGHFSMLGHEVTVFNRSIERIAGLKESKEITLFEAIIGSAKVKEITFHIEKAVKNAEIIMITCTADAHRVLAEMIAGYLEDGQVIVLNPGRTLGALEFSSIVSRITTKRVYIAETNSLIYACRAESPGKVRIIGVKNKVLVSAYPATDTDHVIKKLNSVYDCFSKAQNILVTGLENIGAIFHPPIVLFNAAVIERGEMFYFYQDMTHSVANLIVQADNERIRIGNAFGVNLNSAADWISLAYNGVSGDTLCEKMRNNPAYFKIIAPNTLHSRLMIEDIPTGVLPFVELARMAKVDVPLFQAILTLSEHLLMKDFHKNGRTLINLGIENMNVDEFVRSL
jgi:opine dehydrogenase